MARKRSLQTTGTIVVVEHDSRVLADNPLGDPHLRKLAVWLPPGYDEARCAAAAAAAAGAIPCLFDLVGLHRLRPRAPQLAAVRRERSRARRAPHRTSAGWGRASSCFPDCFTCLGGNQYVNSSAIGRYADYLTREIVPYVDREFRTLASREHRGCFGKSSGGYGAIIHGMQYAQALGRHRRSFGRRVFRVLLPPRLAAHAERARPLPPAAAARRPAACRATGKRRADGRDDGRVERFLEAMWNKEKLNDAEAHALMELAMAATYDPDPKAPLGFRLPVDLDTGELIPKRWAQWRDARPDPPGRHATRGTCASLRGIYIDCGWRDQYHLHFGARILSRQLAAHGIAHTYEEFDDTHSSIDYRMDVSLPFLYRSLKP